MGSLCLVPTLSSHHYPHHHSLKLNREAFISTVVPERGFPHRSRVLGVTWYLKELRPSPGSLLCDCLVRVTVSSLFRRAPGLDPAPVRSPQWCVHILFIYTGSFCLSIHLFRSDSPPLRRARAPSRRLLVAAMELMRLRGAPAVLHSVRRMTLRLPY